MYLLNKIETNNGLASDELIKIVNWCEINNNLPKLFKEKEDIKEFLLKYLNQNFYSDKYKIQKSIYFSDKNDNGYYEYDLNILNNSLCTMPDFIKYLFLKYKKEIEYFYNLLYNDNNKKIPYYYKFDINKNARSMNPSFIFEYKVKYTLKKIKENEIAVWDEKNNMPVKNGTKFKFIAIYEPEEVFYEIKYNNESNELKLATIKDNNLSDDYYGHEIQLSSITLIKNKENIKNNSTLFDCFYLEKEIEILKADKIQQ